MHIFKQSILNCKYANAKINVIYTVQVRITNNYDAIDHHTHNCTSKVVACTTLFSPFNFVSECVLKLVSKDYKT